MRPRVAGGDWHKGQADQAHGQVGVQHLPAGEDQQEGQGEDHHKPALNEDPGALQVEHAPGDQVAGMDAVVKAEGQSLQLLEELQAQVMADLLAEIFSVIARQHGQEAADGGCSNDQSGADPQGLAGRLRGGASAGQQVMGLVNGQAEQARQGQARQGRAQGAENGEAQQTRIAQGPAHDPLQDPRHGLGVNL